jgi:P-type conjugative transfer protein TrbJ
MKRILLIATIFCLATTNQDLIPTAEAGGIGVFATEFTQLLNNIQLAQQTITQAQALQTQFQQYAITLQNAATNPNQVFSSIASDLNNLASTVNTGQGLAYSMGNLDAQFRQTYPGYQSNSQATLTQQYHMWSQSTLDTISNTLMAVGLRSSQLENEQSVLAALQQMSQSDNGAVMVAQTGNQIALEQVAQLQKLQALMLADMQSKQAYFAAQTQSQINSQQVLDQTFQQKQFVGTGKTY